MPTEFDGWGTSLAWWANIDYPQNIAKEICELLFSRDKLGLNIVRYNLGGGWNPSTPPPQDNYVFMPCVQNEPLDSMDFDVDHKQMSILHNAVELGVDNVELFINSPPWWMTLSKSTAGATKPWRNNFNPLFTREFVEYVSNACRYLLDSKIPLKSVELFNEPLSPAWVSTNWQEGCSWSYCLRRRVMGALYHAFQRNRLEHLEIASADEFTSGAGLLWWLFTPKYISKKVNVHGYRLSDFSNIQTCGVEDLGVWRRLLRLFSEGQLWMSEYGCSTHDLEGALGFGQHIMRDLRLLKPRAWIVWQGVSDISNEWGLISVNPLDPTSFSFNMKYYVMLHFTKVLEPKDSYDFVDSQILRVYKESTGEIHYVVIPSRPLNLSFLPERCRVTDATHTFEQVLTPCVLQPNSIYSFGIK